MTSQSVRRYTFGHPAPPFADDWPEARIAEARGLWSTISAVQTQMRPTLRLIVDMRKAGEPPPAGLLGIEFAAGGTELRVEVLHSGEEFGPEFTGPRGGQLRAGWELGIATQTLAGLIEILGPVAPFAGVLRVTHAGMDREGTSELYSRRKLVPLLVQALVARRDGLDAPSEWSEAKPAPG